MTDPEVKQILLEIRDYLKVLAGPQLAERDREGRQKIVDLAGKSVKRRATILAVDGVRSRADIQKAVGIDQGDLSRFVSELKAASLLVEEGRIPRLAVTVDAGMFKS